MKRAMSRYSTQAILYIVSIFAATVFGAYIFVMSTTRDVSLQEQQFLSEIATQNAGMIKTTVEMNLDELEMIAHIVGHGVEMNQESVLALLRIETERSSFKRMGYANPDGDAVATDGETFSINDREYFTKAIAQSRSVSDRLVDKTDGGFINVYATALYHDGEPKGALFATSDTDTFSDVLSAPLFGGKGFSYVVTANGEPVVYAPNQNGFMEFDNLFDIIRENQDGEQKARAMQADMAQGKSGIISYTRNHVERVGAYCRVGVNDWYVVSVVPKSVISQNADQIIRRNVVISILTTILCSALVVLIFVQNHKNRARLERIAYHDELIGMPNFYAFQEQAQKTLERRPTDQFVFVKMDVDNFKLINERLGFAEGDRALRNIAQALGDVVCEPDELFARVAVDEFIIMYNLKSRKELTRLRERFVDRFYMLMGASFVHYVRFPTGRYVTSPGERSITEIFEKVNYAHRQAKLLPEKTGVIEFYYDDAVKARSLRESELEDKMAASLERREFQVYLQPKYELLHETVVGAEALVRWREGNGNLIFPAEFIPLFERNGFITKLDLYMFQQVCAIIRGWIDRGDPVVTVSVNFSRLHLLNPHFIDELDAIANRYAVPHKHIEIELTESVIFENIDRLEAVLAQIHAAGFTMSMDDFGTGYSSLGLLKSLPVDVIKMDRSFFMSTSHKERTKTVVSCVIEMAQRLHIHTVAEGVEDIEHIELLREAGCEVVQGYYYAKPMPAEEFSTKDCVLTQSGTIDL